MAISPQSVSEASGPDFPHLQRGQFDNDLLPSFDHGGLPLGERILVAGQVVDQYGKPIYRCDIRIQGEGETLFFDF